MVGVAKGRGKEGRVWNCRKEGVGMNGMSWKERKEVFGVAMAGKHREGI